MFEYSTRKISTTLLEELKQALRSVSPFGSVEIHVQDSTVTQITVRNIKKTNHQVKANAHTSNKQKVAIEARNFDN